MLRLRVPLLITLLAGCSQSTVKPERIEVKAADDPLHMPRSLLSRYAEGQPLGSEVTSWPHLVEQVRKTDAVRAEILEKGFAEIEAADPAARPAKAEAVLRKIRPSMQ